MIVIPALNLQPDSSRVYATSVAEKVLEWERAGFGRVQLDVPSAGRYGATSRLIEDIVREVHCAVQVSGQFETSDDIDAALSAGAGLVILGARALDEPDWLASAAARFPGQLIVTSPARERRSRTRGALRTLPLDLRDLASEMDVLPIAGLIVEFTSDATIGIPELALLEDVAEDVAFPVLASGGSPGLATLRDLEFRGVSAAVISSAHLSAEFDEQALARSFVD